jgi:hypothetical protein
LLRPRPERVDELEHVVGELVGAVGGGQALDQLQPAVTVLEREELLAVNGCPHVERTKRLLACGRVQDEGDTPCALAEVEHRPLEQLGAKVDGDVRLPVVPVGIEDLPLVGVDGSARAQRRNSLSFEVRAARCAVASDAKAASRACASSSASPRRQSS